MIKLWLALKATGTSDSCQQFYCQITYKMGSDMEHFIKMSRNGIQKHQNPNKCVGLFQLQSNMFNTLTMSTY